MVPHTRWSCPRGGLLEHARSSSRSSAAAPPALPAQKSLQSFRCKGPPSQPSQKSLQSTLHSSPSSPSVAEILQSTLRRSPFSPTYHSPSVHPSQKSRQSTCRQSRRSSTQASPKVLQPVRKVLHSSQSESSPLQSVQKVRHSGQSERSPLQSALWVLTPVSLSVPHSSQSVSSAAPVCLSVQPLPEAFICLVFSGVRQLLRPPKFQTHENKPRALAPAHRIATKVPPGAPELLLAEAFICSTFGSFHLLWLTETHHAFSPLLQVFHLGSFHLPALPQ
jgi:hypothetical protein